MGLLEGIKTRKLRGGRFEVSVKVGRGDVWASLVDVGFGISQFLPIVVADLQLSRGSTLIVAQPEIHLHPSIQALFANYLLDNIGKGKKRYIIETHSEYFLNRLRLLIVQGKLKPSDVAVYHCSRKGCETTLHNIHFLESGKIEGAPKDFFDTYMMDAMDIALNAK